MEKTNYELLEQKLSKFKGVHFRNENFLKFAEDCEHLFYQVYPIVDKNFCLTGDVYDGTNPDAEYVLISNEIAIYIADFLEPFIGKSAVEFSEYCKNNDCQIDEGIFFEIKKDLITGNYLNTDELKNLLYIENKETIFTDININFYIK